MQKSSASITRGTQRQRWNSPCVPASIRYQESNTQKVCDEFSIRAKKISSFEDDVCQKCECLRKKIMDARTDEEKLTSARAFQDHIEAARKEPQHYRECIQKAVEEMGQWQGGQLQNVHYTFDFAQHSSYRTTQDK